jgi:hypothetical protein
MTWDLEISNKIPAILSHCGNLAGSCWNLWHHIGSGHGFIPNGVYTTVHKFQKRCHKIQQDPGIFLLNLQIMGILLDLVGIGGISRESYRNE